jgi:hypothetical protein
MTTGMKICSVSLIIKRQNGSVLWPTPVIPATWEADVGRIVVQGQPREIVLETSSPKEPEQNVLEGHCGAQVIECLLCKCKALSSNPI